MAEIREWLEQVRVDLADICRPHVDSTAKLAVGVRCLMVDLGKGWCYAALSSTAPFEVSDANEAFSSIRVIEHHLDEQGEIIGDPEFLFSHAVKLGRILERIESVCPIEQDAARGKKVKEAAAVGGRLNAKLNEPRKQQARKLVKELIDKGLSQTAACKQVGKDFRVSGKTIRRTLRSVTGTDGLLS